MVGMVVKETVHADTAHKIEERLDEVKAKIGKVAAKSSETEVKELVRPEKSNDTALNIKESKKEVLPSRDMNVVESDVPESKKLYLSKLVVQKEVGKPKVPVLDSDGEPGSKIFVCLAWLLG